MNKKIFITFIFLCLVLPKTLFAALGITSTATTWSTSLTASNLVGGTAGSDVPPTYTNSTTMTIGGSKGAWTISVRRKDSTGITAWNPNYVIQCMRTGNGTGTGPISGGTSYLPITTTNQTFFTGNRNISSIPINLQVANVMISNSSIKTYRTTITYTITGT
jgi:hypothetical protein